MWTWLTSWALNVVCSPRSGQCMKHIPCMLFSCGPSPASLLYPVSKRISHVGRIIIIINKRTVGNSTATSTISTCTHSVAYLIYHQWTVKHILYSKLTRIGMSTLPRFFSRSRSSDQSARTQQNAHSTNEAAMSTKYKKSKRLSWTLGRKKARDEPYVADGSGK